MKTKLIKFRHVPTGGTFWEVGPQGRKLIKSDQPGIGVNPKTKLIVHFSNEATVQLKIKRPLQQLIREQRM